MTGQNNGFFLISTSLSGGKKGLAERLTQLSRRGKHKWYVLATVLLLALALTACSFGGAEPQPPAAEEAPELTTPLYNVPLAVMDTETVYASSDEVAAAYMQTEMDNIGPWYEGPDGPARKFTFIESDITRWELMGSYNDILTGEPVEVYALEYRLLADDPSLVMLSGGMSMDGDRVTQSGSMGDPLLVLKPVEGGYRYLDTIWTSETGSEASVRPILDKEVLRLLYKPRDIDREWESEVKLYMEGQTETMSAYLHTDIGCSIYYEDENLFSYDRWSQDPHSLLRVDYSEDGMCFLALDWQEQPFITKDNSAESDYWQQIELNDGTPATHYSYGTVNGDPAYDADMFQIEGPLGWYLISCFYPDEATEGWGARLTALAFTFQLEDWPDKEAL